MKPQAGNARIEQASTAVQELKTGWTVIAACCVGLACGLGAIPIYTIGILTKPLTAEFGWSRTQVQLIYTASTIGILFAAPLLGIVVDRFGPRRITLACIIGTALGLAATGLFAGPLWSFYALSFFTAIIGVGTVPITWTRVIVGRFTKARGVALGLALAGTGISATLLPSYTSWLLTHYGWRITYFGLAALPLLVALPVSYFFLKEHDDRKVENPGAKSLQAGQRTEPVRHFFSNYRFWILTPAFILIGICTAGMISHFVPLLTDNGIKISQASKFAGVVGISIISGRLFTGFLLDRFWAPSVGFLILLLPSIACAVLFSEVTALTAIIAAVLLGVAAGAEFDLMSYLVSQYFGKTQYGKIYSLLYVVFKIGAGIGGPAFAMSFDTFGTYRPALAFGAVSFAASGLILLFLKDSSVGAQKNSAN